ncbi:hypothetical protein DL766_007767 [Monosporascus sp. MC13-8B]|uniref:Uncharacterized protein n=1 Tax=Monosporascus cannonballus TaxID=155416 RepID=A0ABY0HN66_9PEZI|nr:hypothetical protein DL762_000021 [Monosporascus cannonballus]RYP00704.1 hypothetical protein DL763_000584 [Monosporascus cannonballus]RYP22209.1 hypothetical protein DL766_007767 [Monosporascus sp. MC13-8B]
MGSFQDILLGLFATASAIDIYLHVGGDCGGNAVVCVGINPNTCCSTSDIDIFPTVGFRGIPTHWNLECKGHSGGRCNRLREVQPARNTNFVCLRSGFFSGGGYGFSGRKRADGADGGCTAYQKPDTLLLEDGGKYNIADLEDAPLTQLFDFVLYLEIAASGANSADIPEEFNAYKIE